MTPAFFLTINGIGYLVLGLACAILPEETARLVGLALIGPKGLAEYVAVYGGLEIGMGAFFLLCRRQGMTRPGLLFALCLYAGLVGLRTAAMIANGPTSDLGWALFSLECLFLVVSIVLWTKHSASRQ